ncbi:MAG: CsbD family protein [Rhizomicrobium sp.]|jgi:uncharacterized protein YjbJ (UPF0337 family)
MNKNRIVGSGKQIRGSIKKTVGKALGDVKLQADGKADRIEGKVQNMVGTIEETIDKIIGDVDFQVDGKAGRGQRPAVKR